MGEPLFSVPVQGRESDERYTPRWVFDGLVFDTDPASPVEGGDCVPARTKYTRDDDGLTKPWHGLVWLNPPFSNSAAWADRFREHGNGVFLGPIANGRWWQDLADAADLLWLCADFAFTHPRARREAVLDAARLRSDGTGSGRRSRAPRLVRSPPWLPRNPARRRRCRMMPTERSTTDGNEFPVEIVTTSHHKVAVSWAWENMAGAITPPGAKLVIEVTQLDPCGPTDQIEALFAATAERGVRVCPECGGAGTVRDA